MQLQVAGQNQNIVAEHMPGEGTELKQRYKHLYP